MPPIIKKEESNEQAPKEPFGSNKKIESAGDIPEKINESPVKQEKKEDGVDK